MGFCLFGNVALAALYAKKIHNARRVLIVDWDVHHGNGTQAIVESDPDIHFVSMHQWPWYPGTGAADDRGPHETIWNLPMPPSLPAQNYVDTFESGIDRATDGFIPDIILISAGFDSLAGDPLGGFTLEPSHIAGITERLVSRAKDWCEGRLVSVMEGGYAPDRVAEGAMAHLAALA
jgi:acetoin utilization deacetylase AcuC-like enzyme